MDYKDIVSLLSRVLSPSQAIEVNQYILNLEKRCSELYNENTKLTQKIMKLNAKIAEHDTWEKDKEKYEIVQISPSTFAYQLKGTTQIFCPKCFNDDRVPIHIRPPHTTFVRMQQCPKCKSAYVNDIEQK